MRNLLPFVLNQKTTRFPVCSVLFGQSTGMLVTNEMTMGEFPVCRTYFVFSKFVTYLPGKIIWVSSKTVG